MSRGHERTSATAHTPHGPVTSNLILAWVHCDGCKAMIGRAADALDEGAAVCDEIASDAGWTQDEAGRDLCDECSAKGGAQR